MSSTNAPDSERTGGSAAPEPIAIIGLACRVPGAQDAGQFWRNLVDGVESVRYTTLEEQAARGVAEQALRDPNFVPAMFLVDDVEYFDNAFFGMSAREAEMRDPQHRLFIELAYTALEDSGYDPFRYPGEIGVYAGVGDAGYEWRNVRRNRKVFGTAGALGVALSTHPDFLATMISYKFNLRGPSFTVHCACSTSLVAIHVACEALRNGECDMALSGAASIDMPAGAGYAYVEDGIYSKDGHIRVFDATGTGTVWGNGGGAVVLKRLSDALADGDHVRAVVLGNAVNNDGTTKVGFTAPSMDGQATVIAQALGMAGVDPRTITYVEAHGTGTQLGDPIEVAALSAAYAADSEPGWCAIGSVKSNIGHLGAAAGVAAVIKTALSLEHGLIPPSLNYEKPNPRIDFGQNPFYVNATLSAWKANGEPRRAGVSSFGMGGTNAHLILQEAPPAGRPARDPRPAHLLQLSARTETAVASAARRLADHLTGIAATGAGQNLTDVAFTLRTGRRELAHRIAVAVTDAADAATALTDPKRRIAGTASAALPRLAWMFPGQGAQHAGMGAGLYEAEPVFAKTIDECAELLAGDLGADIRAEIFGRGEDRLAQTAITQPALFAVEYALAELWRSWGIEPAAMVGHSIGEYVAATCAGVFDLPDALHVVAERGRLMQSMPPGAMLAVQLDEARLRTYLTDDLSIATVNGPSACVASGPTAPISELAATLAAGNIGTRALRTSHAFHSPMMEPVLAEFRAVVAAVPLRAPSLPFLSNVTGDWISATDAADPSYWARHLRATVRFGDCMTTLLEDGEWLLVECGPGRQLCGLVKMRKAASGATAVPTMPGRDGKKSELEVLYAAAGQLWVSGVPLDPETFAVPGDRVPLPTYPFERRYHWIEPDSETGGFYEEGATSTGPRPLHQWLTVPAWEELAPVTPQAPAGGSSPVGRCLVFADAAWPGQLADALSLAGADAVLVRRGAEYGRDSEGYTVRPASRDDYDLLLADLIAAGGIPPRVVHAWALDAAEVSAWQAQDAGLFSLLCLAQALAAEPPEQGMHVDVLTAGTADVSGPDLRRPEYATVAGIAKVVPLEMPWLTVRHIDLDPGPADPRTTRRLAGELGVPAGQLETLAIRHGRGWQRRYKAVDLPAATPLRKNGVYVITGGLGGIGITLAEDLAVRDQASLVLVTRSGLPPREAWDEFIAIHGTTGRAGRAIAAIGRMEAAGAKVLVVAADVTSVADMRDVRERALAAFGRIDYLVHAAGLPGGGMAEVKQQDAAKEVMAPKVAGTLALQEAFGDLDLGMVMLCSSLYAIAGEFGQLDYCAANNFMDAYARGEHGWRAPVISANWGSWLDVGMSAEVAAPAAFRALQRGDRTSPVDHPLLTHLHAGEAEQPGWCSGVVSASTHWLLADHRISGVPVIPGTGQLEAVRRAFVEVCQAPSARHVVELRDVAFVEPMSVPDGGSAELRVVFTTGTDGLDFQAVSLTGGVPRVHAQGSVAWIDDGEVPVADLAAIKDRCTLTPPDGRPPTPISGGMLTFGAHWGNLRRVHEGPQEELALLEATSATTADLAGWVLHPALLDEATAYGRTSGDGRFLPLGYGRVRVRGPLPGRFYSHVRHSEAGGELNTADLSLLDQTGRELVSITEFTLRHVDVDALSALVSSGGTTGKAAGEALASGSAAGGIRPADGAEIFRRLAGGSLTGQVVISVAPIEDVIASTREFTQETIATDLDAGSAFRPGDRSADDGYVAPRTDLEKTIAGIWADVLGGQVGVTDDFFEAGGNSLVAVQLIALVRKELGVRLPMRTIFEEPTVAGTAKLIEAAGDRPEDSAAGTAPAPIPRLPRPVADSSSREGDSQ